MVKNSVFVGQSTNFKDGGELALHTFLKIEKVCTDLT